MQIGDFSGDGSGTFEFVETFDGRARSGSQSQSLLAIEAPSSLTRKLLDQVRQGRTLTNKRGEQNAEGKENQQIAKWKRAWCRLQGNREGRCERHAAAHPGPGKHGDVRPIGLSVGVLRLVGSWDQALRKRPSRSHHDARCRHRNPPPDKLNQRVLVQRQDDR